MTENTLINRVANSGLKTIDLENYFPEGEISTLDIKQYLFKELLLKEKDFRLSLKEHDWSQYQDKILLVNCSSDAIIPMWAYMLVSAYARPFAKEIFQGSQEEFLKQHYHKALGDIDAIQYQGERVVVKGCGDKPVPAYAYSEITKLLQPFAQSIMFGEPCSTVPIFKRPRDLNKT